ncbi:hypothetical protein DPMN_029351 [Dreissena polymorpha]|uniref:Uncharacterized protein n=1 Tax=Dreissena polymorpha TaxID=45954 RepID=A0A9D4M0N0_DREPO|nr:hypothetical protein DPMN_029351 [Dreissena polymorpha]
MKNNNLATSTGSTRKGVYSMLLRQHDNVVAENRSYFACLIRTTFFAVKKHWASDSVKDLMQHIQDVGKEAEQSQGRLFTPTCPRNL